MLVRHAMKRAALLDAVSELRQDAPRIEKGWMPPGEDFMIR